ncbi:cytochrome c oxidase subunit 3 [Rhizomicrobium palustre]
MGSAEAVGHGAGGPAPQRIVVGYGFWIFLLSDIVMFSAFFATYGVLLPETAGGPGPRDIFDLTTAGWETAFLLASSFACTIATLGVEQRSQRWTQIGLLVAGLFGVGFLALEFREFADLIEKGYGPERSAFLTSFFTLVGCHGAHVSLGLLWLGTMMAQFYAKGFRETIVHRFLCFSLFWHALDIIWVAIFTVVYLMGVRL